MSLKLTSSELDALLSKRIIAKLATEGGDGFAHVVSVWFLYSRGELLIPTNKRTTKVRNIRRNSRVSVLIDAAQDSIKTKGVLIKGRATISELDAAEVNRRIHQKYVPRETLEDPRVSEVLAMDDITIHVKPEKTVSWDLTKLPISELRGLDLEF